MPWSKSGLIPLVEVLLEANAGNPCLPFCEGSAIREVQAEYGSELSMNVNVTDVAMKQVVE
jgi:hypothetical protein